VKLVLGRWPGQFDRCFSTPAPCKQRLASPAKWTGSLWVPHCRRRPAVTAAAPKHLAISPCNSYRYKYSIIYLMRIVDIANRVKCRFGLDLSRTCWIRVCLVSFTGELHSVPVRRPNLRALECELMERIKRDRPAGVDRVPVSKPHPEGCEVSSAQAPFYRGRHQAAGGRQLPLPHVHAATPALMSAVAQYFNGPSSARRRTRNKVFASDPSADLSGVGFGDDATKIVGFEGLEPSRRARVQYGSEGAPLGEA
jgi:hypothetical protein